MQLEVEKNGWEGLILRKNSKYQGKRTKDLLKVKQFFREEYKVKDLEFAKMRVINEDTGLEEEITTLKAVTISHKGFDVSVGSGFKLQERKNFYANPDLIKGKVISVQYFEETKGKKDAKSKEETISLRFPTFLGVYGEKRDF
jgi:DNA ligase-1